MKYYTLDKILTHNADYNLVIGERSNGKTTASMMYVLDKFLETGKQFAYVRREETDIKTRYCATLFENLQTLGYIERVTKGEYDSVRYFNGSFILTNSKAKKGECDEQLIGKSFALSIGHHYKSSAYPLIDTIVFDEFMTDKSYLVDEFRTFLNLVSTIFRTRTGVKVFMLANTVSRYCPYFKQMGLQHIKHMHQGEIKVYESDFDYGLRVALEYCEDSGKTSKEKKMTGFRDQAVKMINNGHWETKDYPKIKDRVLPEDYIFTVHIEFNEYNLQCNIIINDDKRYLFVHPETTPPNEDELMYTDIADGRLNYRLNILQALTPIEKVIKELILTGKVCFTDDEIGEAFYSYVKWCKTQGIA